MCQSFTSHRHAPKRDDDSRTKSIKQTVSMNIHQVFKFSICGDNLYWIFCFSQLGLFQCDYLSDLQDYSWVGWESSHVSFIISHVLTTCCLLLSLTVILIQELMQLATRGENAENCLHFCNLNFKFQFLNKSLRLDICLGYIYLALRTTFFKHIFK